MEVLTPGTLHPNFHRQGWLRSASFRSRLKKARRRLISRGATRIALYIWRDEYADALDLIEHDWSCYHIDDEYSFAEQDLPTPTREEDLLRRVDQVIIHSPALFEKKGHLNHNTALIPNGVDFRLFSTPHMEPTDIASLPHPRVGYVGVIKKQLDFGLLIRLAGARPQYSFVLVGPVMNVLGRERQLATLRRFPNVHFLGGKPATDLPAYIQHFDVCLMCYEVNDYTRYIYPLKLHEYLATGRPIVSSPIETVQRFAQVVALASDEAEWLTAIDRAVREVDSEGTAAQARRAAARANDWDLLVEQIATLFAPTAQLSPSLERTILQAS
jgi:glycosyltransferase involved in cell wall biosynthesis